MYFKGDQYNETDSWLNSSSRKDLLITGVYHQHKLGKITLVASDEKSTPFSFTLLPPVELTPAAAWLPATP